MKRLIIIGILLLLVHRGQGQSTPEAFLGLLPPIPSIDCGMDYSRQTVAIEAFQAQLNGTVELLSAAIRSGNNNSKNHDVPSNMKRQAKSQSGLSDEELTSVSADDTPNKEKDRIINKSVQSQTGFSMDEMQQVKKMTAEERKKWAMQNYGNVMNNASPQNNGAQSGSGSHNSMLALAQEQQKIALNLQNHYSRLTDMRQEIVDLAGSQLIIMNSEIKGVEQRYANVNDGEGASAEDMRKLHEKLKLVRDAKVGYCSKLTPLYINYLVSYNNILKEHILPDLKRQEEINLQLNPAVQPNAVDRLKAVKKYAEALKSAFDYYLPVNN